LGWTKPGIEPVLTSFPQFFHCFNQFEKRFFEFTGGQCVWSQQSMDDKVAELEKKVADLAEKLDAARALIALGDHPKQCEPSGEVFSIEETAQILKVSTKSVYRLIQRGLLKSLRAFRHHRITRDSIDRFLKAV
jgi:excisionase family DNA binding protein